MTEAQKRLRELRERQSRERGRMAELSRVETLDDEQRAEMDRIETGTPDLERQLRAAQVALDAEQSGETETRTVEPGTEARELARLERRASIGDIFAATLEHRQTDAETAELQQHLGLSANQVPLALLRDPNPIRLETRAVTPAPADVGQNQQPIIPGVFPQSVAAFLGVDMPTVGVGEAVFPVLTKNAEAKTPAEGADAAETTGSFSADVLSPSRLQASFYYSREDRARFAGMDAALRQNLGDALADALDKQVVAGTNGLFTGTNLANHNVNTVTAFADYKSNLAYGRVDGTWASTVGDLRIVVGSATYAHAATAYRANNADDSVLDVLMARTAGVRVSAHVPGVANNKQNTVIRRGMRRDMVAPVWEGVTLIPDEVTKAKSGEIVVTAVMLYAVKILRTDGFYKQQTQHA